MEQTQQGICKPAWSVACHGVLIKALLCYQARHFSLWIPLLQNGVNNTSRSHRALCRLVPTGHNSLNSELGSLHGALCRTPQTSSLNSGSADSANFRQSLPCLLRKMNVSLSHKTLKIHRLFPLLSSSEPYEFVSLEWLQKWLDESTPTKPIDNHACLCSHDKLHPDKISIMKRISEYAADIFYSRYGGGPRLTGNWRCRLYLERSNTLSSSSYGLCGHLTKPCQTRCPLHFAKRICEMKQKLSSVIHVVFIMLEKKLILLIEVFCCFPSQGRHHWILLRKSSDGILLLYTVLFRVLEP